MHPTISRRILVTAVVLILAGSASAPASLTAASLATAGVTQSAHGTDLLGQARLWWSAIWPWESTGASSGTAPSRTSPNSAKPRIFCGADPDGLHCTNATKPQIVCGADPNGTQHCSNVVKPQITCSADPSGVQHCTDVVRH